MPTLRGCCEELFFRTSLRLTQETSVPCLEWSVHLETLLSRTVLCDTLWYTGRPMFK